MKINDDGFAISNSESIPWEDVKALRILNDKFVMVLNSGRIIELEHLRPSTIDTAFRSYERYLKSHPEKRN